MAVPTVACSAAAAALATTGVSTACAGAVPASVTGAVSSAVSGVAGFGVDSVLDALGSWVAAGASWVLGNVGAALSATTSVDLGTAWFGSHYATMAALCGVVIVPLLLLGVIQSLVRQSPSLLLRSLLVNVPLALLLTAVAVKLVGVGLAVTDAMSAAVDGGSGADVGHALTSVGVALTATGATGVPAFVVFMGGILVALGAMAVWLELLIRSAAVEVAVLFLPLALASLAWPAIAHWCRRLLDTLAALILSKFAIVAVLSLAVSALAGGAGWSPAGGTSSGGGGGFAAVFTGGAMLLLAAFMPFAVLRLLPLVEAGAVSHLEAAGARARGMVTAPARMAAGTALRSAAGPLAAAAMDRALQSDPLPGGGGGGGAAATSRPPDDSGVKPGSAPGNAPGEPTAMSMVDDVPDLREYPDHPEATAEFRRLLDDLAVGDGEGDEGGSSSGAALPGTTAEPTPTPTSTPTPPPASGPGLTTDRDPGGAGSPGWRPPRHRISSDHLGPKLVMIDPDESGPGDP